MGYTKIWTISTRLDNSMNYITNPNKTKFKLDIEAVEGPEKYITNKDKTESALYVDVFNCSRENAVEQMITTQYEKGKSHRVDGILAYHLVQSFKDFETTPDIAHQCGVELVQRLFADRFQVVLATHVDKDHLHNHIIFNAVSFTDGYKYRNQFRDYFGDIRSISDQICREHCLYVIENPKHKGMSYIEWLKENEGKSIRQYVREEIDTIIQCSYSMQEFWKNLELRGYQVTRRGPQYKYTSFIPSFGTKRIRLDKLGKYYTEEAIKERIIANRNGIKMASPSELSNGFDYGSTYKKANPTKLKGFVALYYHYLYLFGVIKKKKVPQRVSFYMRDELIKFDRYKKQFEFMYKNEIETGTQLSEHKKSKEDKINDLVEQRKMLYASKTEDNEQEIKAKAQAINDELRELRKDVRMCTTISRDSYKISQKQQKAQELQQQAEMEAKANEHKRRGR